MGGSGGSGVTAAELGGLATSSHPLYSGAHGSPFGGRQEHSLLDVPFGGPQVLSTRGPSAPSAVFGTGPKVQGLLGNPMNPGKESPRLGVW